MVLCYQAVPAVDMKWLVVVVLIRTVEGCIALFVCGYNYDAAHEIISVDFKLRFLCLNIFWWADVPIHWIAMRLHKNFGIIYEMWPSSTIVSHTISDRKMIHWFLYAISSHFMGFESFLILVKKFGWTSCPRSVFHKKKKNKFKLREAKEISRAINCGYLLQRWFCA